MTIVTSTHMWWWCCCVDHALRQEIRDARALLEEARERADAWKVADAAESAVARRYECKLCMARPYGAAFLPCGHVLCCAECAAGAASCPVCSERVECVAPLYLV